MSSVSADGGVRYHPEFANPTCAYAVTGPNPYLCIEFSAYRPPDVLPKSENPVGRTNDIIYLTVTFTNTSELPYTESKLFLDTGNPNHTIIYGPPPVILTVDDGEGPLYPPGVIPPGATTAGVQVQYYNNLPGSVLQKDVPQLTLIVTFSIERNNKPVSRIVRVTTNKLVGRDNYFPRQKPHTVMFVADERQIHWTKEGGNDDDFGAAQEVTYVDSEKIEKNSEKKEEIL